MLYRFLHVFHVTVRPWFNIQAVIGQLVDLLFVCFVFALDNVKSMLFSADTSLTFLLFVLRF